MAKLSKKLKRQSPKSWLENGQQETSTDGVTSITTPRIYTAGAGADTGGGDNASPTITNNANNYVDESVQGNGNININNNNNSNSNNSKLKVPGLKRRISTRDFFHGLLYRHRHSSLSHGSPSTSNSNSSPRPLEVERERVTAPHSVHSAPAVSAEETAVAAKSTPSSSPHIPKPASRSIHQPQASPASPRSPPDPNKPLPSRPQLPLSLPLPLPLPSPSSSNLVSPSDSVTIAIERPILKLDRIMATLTESDIEKLFSGAPQYFARSEGHCSGAPNPSVAFPFDEELEIRDLADYVQIEDKAWSGVTAWPHLTRDLNRDAAAKKRHEDSHKAHFYIRCRERPNMLSIQGLEKGTMGYSAALELAVGDNLDEEQFGFDSVGKKANAIIEARERMTSPNGMLHRLPETQILDRLKKNGDLYRDNDLRRKKTADSYMDMFHTFMRPCHTVVDRRDHYSLANQINALIKCLGTSNVWFDFSHVEWRIRLGQILWGSDEGDDLEDTSSIHNAASVGERNEERYWLLMQIMVATELLIRLDAITEGEEYGVEAFRPIDVVHFERAATRMVKWSLHLARSWLENINITKTEMPHIQSKDTEPPASWLTSLVSKITLLHQENTEPQQKHHYTIKGRHGQRQVDGLIHFAKKLQWPGIDTYESRISARAQDSGVVNSTPPATSTTTNSKHSSYFGSWDVSSHKMQKSEKVQTQRRKLAAALHTSGWLSKSYVFGLVLPGEGMYHFLMATLLENDSEAMAKLGPFANLCGGFVYSGKSFWSTSCIVGRVIAAGKGSAECMGWISSDIVPIGFQDGWVNIDAADVAHDRTHLGRKARLWAKKRIEKESSILGDGEEESVLPADFIIPHESSYSTPPPLVGCEFQSLELLGSDDGSMQTTPLTMTSAVDTNSTNSSKAPELLSYPTNISFKVSLDGYGTKEHTFALSYDVNFVTAHPCTPSHRVKFLKSPSSPTIQQIDVSGEDMFGKNARPAHRTGHPLHKFYGFKVIHISELLRRQDFDLEELLSSNNSENAGFSHSRPGSNRVLVIDCITNLFDIPSSPSLERAMLPQFPIVGRRGSFPAAAQMHFESRKRQFGSDMEILVRALCAQKGWNAIISRRKRGCLACAIREAGALQWKVIIRVE